MPVRYWKSILWMCFIFVLSAVPGKEVPYVPIWNFDKLTHSGLYFVMSLLLVHDIKRSAALHIVRRHALAIAILLSIAYGGLLEVLQAHLFIDRSGDWLDLGANGFGALMAAMVAPWLFPSESAKPASGSDS